MKLLRQALGIFGLQAIEDHFQDLAADIPQKSLQFLLELECGPRSNTLPKKRHHHPCHLLAHLLANATKFFSIALDPENWRARLRCRMDAFNRVSERIQRWQSEGVVSDMIRRSRQR